MLNERKRWVAAVSHGRPEVRITMTYPVIESSRRVAFLVAGEEKAGSSARSGPAAVEYRPRAFSRSVSCFGSSIKWRPAKNRRRATGRARNDIGKSFHTRSRACQSARTDVVDHHRALRSVGRFRSTR